MSQNDDSRIVRVGQMLGLHPLVGFGMFAVDSMLFAETLATAGIGWTITVPVAVALTIPCVLLQKYAFGDGWGVAIGKGLMVGVLTAIPTPLPSIITVGGGVLGTAKILMSRSPKQLPPPAKHQEIPPEIEPME
ncbi:MAG: hypothetical protein KKA73_09700 [Chloroflexi bacterium]|nr:hypothetical protein [Chloroflexota bacterium]MBU1747951.1 hypothetical protein [Chloroflexota bacterium]